MQKDSQDAAYYRAKIHTKDSLNTATGDSRLRQIRYANGALPKYAPASDVQNVQVTVTPRKNRTAPGVAFSHPSKQQACSSISPQNGKGV